MNVSRIFKLCRLNLSPGLFVCVWLWPAKNQISFSPQHWHNTQSSKLILDPEMRNKSHMVVASLMADDLFSLALKSTFMGIKATVWQRWYQNCRLHFFYCGYPFFLHLNLKQIFFFLRIQRAIVCVSNRDKRNKWQAHLLWNHQWWP